MIEITKEQAEQVADYLELYQYGCEWEAEDKSYDEKLAQELLNDAKEVKRLKMDLREKVQQQTKNQDPFEDYANPNPGDIDVALADKPCKIEQNQDGSSISWYEGEDGNGKKFLVGVTNSLNFMSRKPE